MNEKACAKVVNMVKGWVWIYLRLISDANWRTKRGKKIACLVPILLYFHVLCAALLPCLTKWNCLGSLVILSHYITQVVSVIPALSFFVSMYAWYSMRQIPLMMR